jgi:hypothetical protein
MGTFPAIDKLRAAVKAKTAPALPACPKKQAKTRKNDSLRNQPASG